jgi:hypothetical protein
MLIDPAQVRTGAPRLDLGDRKAIEPLEKLLQGEKNATSGSRPNRQSTLRSAPSVKPDYSQLAPGAEPSGQQTSLQHTLERGCFRPLWIAALAVHQIGAPLVIPVHKPGFGLSIEREQQVLLGPEDLHIEEPVFRHSERKKDVGTCTKRLRLKAGRSRR